MPPTYDFNVFERRANELIAASRPKDAMAIYLFMADGDPSLDAGYLAERIGYCCELLGDQHAARWWYGRQSRKILVSPVTRTPADAWSTFPSPTSSARKTGGGPSSAGRCDQIPLKKHDQIILKMTLGETRAAIEAARDLRTIRQGFTKDRRHRAANPSVGAVSGSGSTRPPRR